MWRFQTLWDFRLVHFNFPVSERFGIFRAPGVEIGKTEGWNNTYCRVNLNTMTFVPADFSCTDSQPLCTWRNVMNGYKRNIHCKRKHHIWIRRAFPRPRYDPRSKSARFPLFETCLVRCFTTPVILSKADPTNCQVKWLNESCSQKLCSGMIPVRRRPEFRRCR
jgi:hypothetical protein